MKGTEPDHVTLMSPMMLRQEVKRVARQWLSRSPWLFEKIRVALGRPSHELRVMRCLVRPGDTVLDIGANIGQFTFLLGYMVGHEGAVHAFEPLPVSFRALCEAASRNPIPCRLFLNNCVLSDTAGTVSIVVPGHDSTQASIIPHRVGSWRTTDGDAQTQSYGINAKTLDGYLAEKVVKDVAFVKCDVEGAELLVLQGAQALLRQHVPPLLLIEVYEGWTRDFGYEPRDLFDFLANTSNYTFYHVGETGPRPLANWHEAVPGAFPDYLNFLCVIPDVHRNRLIRVLQV